MHQLLKTSSIPFQGSIINWHKLQFIKPYCAVIAAFLIQLLVGGLLAIGNLLPYIASYVSYVNNISLINDSNNECTSQIQTIYSENLSTANWILSASVTGYAIIGPIGGKLFLYYQSMRLTIVIGCSIICVGIYLTYYVIHSMLAVIFCFGFIFGIGAGIYWGSSISAAINWFPNQRGFVTGFVIFGMGLGQMVFDFIETLYINPNNIESSAHCGYILNIQIIERIPQCFILLATISAFITVFAILLFFHKPIANQNANISASSLLNDNTFDNTYDFTSSEAMKTFEFWLIFCDCFLMMTLLCFVYSEWKIFAQDYIGIDNDDFLLKLGMFASFMNAAGRIFWGYYFDKTHSYAISMGTATFVLTFFLGTMPLCYYVYHKELIVFIWITILYVCVGATYSIIPPTLTHTFGMKYNAVILGMIVLSDIPSSILESSIVYGTQNHWIILCSIMACIGAISFLLAIVYPMNKSRTAKITPMLKTNIK